MTLNKTGIILFRILFTSDMACNKTKGLESCHKYAVKYRQQHMCKSNLPHKAVFLQYYIKQCQYSNEVKKYMEITNEIFCYFI